MSENINDPATEVAETTAEAENQTEAPLPTTGDEKSRPSIILGLSGLIAVLVGGWALTGEDFVALIHSDLLGWVAITIAIAIGVALVAVPTRRNRS
ncbi:LPXTG cell wall anchor domain-containing protein [Mycobacteroides saopaulense]|uniref:Uncharacterized protein n=1 Tax=Mycobacteroides saopaulense TaxID=1578165 RepID=A0A1S1JMX4_9MYCO|nr:LPXTG cell wall anchor domain-containing protein [Mycobacteroides saopaulense]ALR12841.1 hypothetical protein MYCSP_17155 [Mycobacteroides saopaulense]OHT88838.1 hypothetical protein BKG68_02845 [Mycobacteroides saopaulense]OHU13658.1 hypothetical protein BKG73_02850 [Mycobacteroides saopaulense]ORB56723.1 hypothetical protein BST43_13100 [Mycobacteroides saopaulense]